MCKVYGMAGISNKNRGDAIKILKDITEKMTRHEKDGFGYAAINKEGHVYGEKWLRPKDCWKKRVKRKIKPAKEIIPDTDKPVLNKFEGLIEGYKKTIQKSAPPVYDNFGDGELGDAVAIIAHSRYGTGASVNIENVHPFVNFETAMVHNGIVWNHEDPIFYKEVSTCDSEVILNQYNNELVQMDSRRIQDAVSPLEAYFSCLVLTNAMDDKEKMYPVMDIFKSDANLDVVYIHDLGLYAFCTDGSIIVDVCKLYGYSTSKPISITDNFLIRMDAITGEITERMFFEYTNKHTYYSDTYYKSKYGENWQDYVDNVFPLGNDKPDYREDSDEKDPDEPSYRSAEESARTFVEKGNELVDMSEMEWNPFDDGSDLMNENSLDASSIILEEEERKMIEEKYNVHRDRGKRHAK